MANISNHILFFKLYDRLLFLSIDMDHSFLNITQNYVSIKTFNYYFTYSIISNCPDFSLLNSTMILNELFIINVKERLHSCLGISMAV